MAFPKLLAFAKKVSDFADQVTGNPAEIKAQFDAAPEELRQTYNTLIDGLKSSTAGDSGAKNIGVATIPGLTGNDIQTLLEKLAERGAFYGKGDYSGASGFFIFPSNQWVTEFNENLFAKSGSSNMVFKKAGLYQVNISCTRSDLLANQSWKIGYAINDDSTKLFTEEMITGQYGWSQTGGPNLTKVPLRLSHMVRVNANDYINFNSNSPDGPRSYGLKFNVERISD